MTKEIENDDFQLVDGKYSYSINCPSCQDSPEAELDGILAKGCDACKGIGEITLQLTETELADLYKQYLGVTPDERSSSCPYMAGKYKNVEGQESLTCPVTGTHKV
jgi:hypothetical protein